MMAGRNIELKLIRINFSLCILAFDENSQLPVAKRTSVERKISGTYVFHDLFA